MTQKTILIEELKERCLNELMALPDGTSVIFGGGDLSFYRNKWRNQDKSLIQVEFTEVYEVTQE